MKYAIIFFDKSVLWVNQEQAYKIDNLIASGKSQPFKVDNNVYTTSSISKILSEREYKEQYPDKETGMIFVDNFEKNNLLKEPDLIDYQYQTIEQRARGHKFVLKELIKGITQYIDQNPDNCKNAKEIKKRFKLSLAKLKQDEVS